MYTGIFDQHSCECGVNRRLSEYGVNRVCVGLTVDLVSVGLTECGMHGNSCIHVFSL